MKRNNSIRSVVLIVFVLVSTMVFAAGTRAEFSYAESSEEYIGGGSCGSGVTWELTGTQDSMTLTLSKTSESGDGRMTGYAESAIPWAPSRDKIKKVVIESGITSIGHHAFYEMVNLKEISIADTVAYIEGYVFWNCRNLTKITLPKQLIGIGDAAFYGCESLSEIEIPDGIQNVGSGAFEGCASLRSAVFHGEIPYGIGAYAFYGCTSLEYVDLPEISYITQYCFYGCEKLKDIKMPSGMASIGDHAFYGCKSLTDAGLTGGVGQIGSYAYYDCTSLTDVVIPFGVTEIGEYAFYNCSGLKSMTIPESVSTIGDEAFRGCSGCNFSVTPNSYAEYYLSTHDLTLNEDEPSDPTDDPTPTDPGDDPTPTDPSDPENPDDPVDPSDPSDPGASAEPVPITGVTLSSARFEFTGKAITPKITVNCGDSRLSKSDYTVSYKSNKKIGTATMIITGKGEYTGTIKKTFRIVPDRVKIKATSSPIVEGTQIVVKVSSKCKPKYYELILCRDKKCKKVIAKAKFKTKDLVKHKIYAYKKLKKGKSYYIKVRAVVSARQVGAYSKTKRIKGRG